MNKWKMLQRLVFGSVLTSSCFLVGLTGYAFNLQEEAKVVSQDPALSYGRYIGMPSKIFNDKMEGMKGWKAHAIKHIWQDGSLQDMYVTFRRENSLPENSKFNVGQSLFNVLSADTNVLNEYTTAFWIVPKFSVNAKDITTDDIYQVNEMGVKVFQEMKKSLTEKFGKANYENDSGIIKGSKGGHRILKAIWWMDDNTTYIITCECYYTILSAQLPGQSKYRNNVSVWIKHMDNSLIM